VASTTALPHNKLLQKFIDTAACCAPLRAATRSLINSNNNYSSIPALPLFCDDLLAAKHYNACHKFASASVVNCKGLPISFIEQTECASGIGYEQLINTRGQVLTRSNNLHDFFNAMVWHTFPQFKVLVNEMHIAFKKQSKSNDDASTELHCDTRGQQAQVQVRSSVQNFLTHLDEFGTILVFSKHESKSETSCSSCLETLFRNMHFKQLFYNERERFERDVSCVIVGHALYERLYSPFIGITGKALALTIDHDEHMKMKLMAAQEGDYTAYDALLSQHLRKIFNEMLHKQQQQGVGITDELLKPRELLLPLPILGVPGYHYNMQDEVFYDNSQYFRTSRRAAKQ